MTLIPFPSSFSVIEIGWTSSSTSSAQFMAGLLEERVEREREGGMKEKREEEERGKSDVVMLNLDFMI